MGRALVVALTVVLLAQINGVSSHKTGAASGEGPTQAYWLPPNFHPDLNNIAISGPAPYKTQGDMDVLASKVANILMANKGYTQDMSIDPKLYSFLETSAMQGHARVRRHLRGRKKKKEPQGAAVYNAIAPIVGTNYYLNNLGNSPAAQATVDAKTPPHPGAVNSLVHASIAGAPGFSQFQPGPAIMTNGQPMNSVLGKVNPPVLDNGRADYMNVNMQAASQYHSMPVPAIVAA